MVVEQWYGTAWRLSQKLIVGATVHARGKVRPVIKLAHDTALVRRFFRALIYFPAKPIVAIKCRLPGHENYIAR